MQTIYNVDQTIKDKLLIDTPHVLGKVIKSFDEYCMYFPLSRQLFYKHLKHSTEQVPLSYLHKRYYDECGKFWKYHADEIAENVTTYARVVNANVRDDYSWKTYGAWLAAVYFDKTKLQYHRVAQAASRVFHDCYMSSYKHWTVPHTRLHATRDNITNNYHLERMQLTKDIFENIVLKGVKQHKDLSITYAYDRVECTTHDNYTIRIIIGAFDLMKAFIDVAVLHDQGQVSIESRKTLILAKVCSRYPAIGKIIENLEQNATKVLKYIQQIRDLAKKHEYFARQQQLTLRTILHELRSKSDTSSFTSSRLTFVMLNPNSLQTLRVHYNKRRRLQYLKTTYLFDKGKYTKVIESHLRTSFVERGVDKLAEHLMCSGFVNIHENKVPIEDYEHYLTGESLNIGHIVYKTTYSELAPRLHQYFKNYHEHLIETYRSGQLDNEFVRSDEFESPAYMNYFDFKKLTTDSERFYNFHGYQSSERTAYLKQMWKTYSERYKTLLPFMTQYAEQA